jgi:hypothetical protein
MIAFRAVVALTVSPALLIAAVTMPSAVPVLVDFLIDYVRRG